MVNKVILIGNLGKDPVVRTTNTGTRVAEFSLATTEKWKDDAGAKHEQTEWHRIVAWSGLANVVGEHLRKGARVYIEGALHYRKWTDRDGKDHYTTEVKADQLRLLGSKPASSASAPDGAPDGDFGDDDISF